MIHGTFWGKSLILPNSFRSSTPIFPRIIPALVQKAEFYQFFFSPDRMKNTVIQVLSKNYLTSLNPIPAVYKGLSERSDEVRLSMVWLMLRLRSSIANAYPLKSIYKFFV